MRVIISTKWVEFMGTLNWDILITYVQTRGKISMPFFKIGKKESIFS